MITYGSEIQFMHKDSGYFLMSMNECSQTQQIGYRVEVSNEYNSKMIFTFLPRYKSRRIGDCIQFTDEVFIKNIKINSYLSISTIPGDSNPSLNLQQTNPYVYPSYNQCAKSLHRFSLHYSRSLPGIRAAVHLAAVPPLSPQRRRAHKEE